MARIPPEVRSRRGAVGVLALQARVWGALKVVNAPGPGDGVAAGSRQRGRLAFGGTVALGHGLAEGAQDDVTTT